MVAPSDSVSSQTRVSRASSSNIKKKNLSEIEQLVGEEFKIKCLPDSISNYSILYSHYGKEHYEIISGRVFYSCANKKLKWIMTSRGASVGLYNGSGKFVAYIKDFSDDVYNPKGMKIGEFCDRRVTVNSYGAITFKDINGKIFGPYSQDDVYEPDFLVVKGSLKYLLPKTFHKDFNTKE